MPTPKSLFPALLFLALLPLNARSQQLDRVPLHPEASMPVRLPGHVPRWATPAGDAGPTDSAAPLRLTFVLTRDPASQAAFSQLLADQQDPASLRFHQWLTPQQIGDLYGPTPGDLAALSGWLTARGLPTPEISPSRLFLTVTAPTASVAQALSTSFHTYTVGAERHVALTQDPALPAAFAGLVSSIAGLADPLELPLGHGESVAGQPRTVAASRTAAAPQPDYDYNSTTHYITPGDFATLFDLNVPYGQYYTGAGQRVAIIGRSRVVTTDITELEAAVALGANVPNVVIPNALYDPGYSGGGDQSEATLDVGRVTGTAPGAQIDLVILSNSGGGIFSATQYAVSTLNDPIINISFGACESIQGATGVARWDTLFSQAAAQGISVFVSSSDSGAATCDQDFTMAPATQILSINYICASSYATCVGGTELADAANPALYWSSTNAFNLSSAVGYIPEGAWNEPSLGLNQYVVQAGGGGASVYIQKPSWQTGPGVPADGARDVPDISYPAAAHDGYYACYAAGNGDCSINRFEYFYGTSTAAPSMAAVAAILNQRTGTRQGNFNPTLYRLAATANTVFHDTTVASSGVSNCSVTVPSMCNNSTPATYSLTGGLAGYLVGPGYDQATGLGSTDVNNLLTALGPTQAPDTLALTSNPATVYTDSSVMLTATLGSTSSGTPAGSVQFVLDGVFFGNPVPLTAGSATTPVAFANALGPSPVSMVALYSGDAHFAAAKATLNLVVTPPGFSVSSNPATLSLTAGATTLNSVTLTYSSFDAFTATITQSCTVTFSGGAVPTFLPTCSFSAPTVVLPANGSVQGTLTLGSTTPHLTPAAGNAAQLLPGAQTSSTPALLLAGLILLAVPGPNRRLLTHRLRSTAEWRSGALAALAVVTLLSLAGCGGSSSSAPSTPALIGTTPGVYTIAITSAPAFTNILPTPAATIALTIH